MITRILNLVFDFAVTHIKLWEWAAILDLEVKMFQSKKKTISLVLSDQK